MPTYQSNVRHRFVKWWDDERDIGNRIIVTLIEGRAFHAHPDDRVAEHVRGFDNVKQALARIRQAEVCNCARCTGEQS